MTSQDDLDSPPSRKPWERGVPLVALALSFLFRAPSFYWTSIDWDESLYFLMAKGFLRGESLYLTVWENKPPGIYMVFALSQLLFGSSVFAARIAACIAVALTASLLYACGRDVLASRQTGAIAGVLYIAYSVSNVGLAANTEIFFTPFVVLAFYLLLARGHWNAGSPSPTAWFFVLVGVCLGCSMQVKYVTLFDLLGAMVITLCLSWAKESRPGLWAGCWRCGLLLLGAGVTFAVPAVAFWWTGHFAEYAYANFAANWIHSSDASFSLVSFSKLMAGQLKTNLLPWCAVLLGPLFLAVYGKFHPAAVRDLAILGTWLGFGMLGVVFTRRVNLHNFLQVLPELCLIGAYVTVVAIGAGGSLDRKRRAFLTLLVVFLGAFRPLYDSTRAALVPLDAEARAGMNDVPAHLAQYLRGKLAPGESVYIVDSDPIVYHLLGLNGPTRFVLPPYLIDDHFVKVAGIDPVQELDRIMQSDPQYVAVLDRERDTPFYGRLREHLKADYREETQVDGVFLYSRTAGRP